VPDQPLAGTIARLDIEPPARLAVGRGTAFAIAGHCHNPAGRTRALEIRIGESLQPADRFGLPRDDVYGTAAGPERGLAYRSGFVATPAVSPIEAPCALGVEAVLTLAGGAEAVAPLGGIALEPRLAVPEHDPPVFPAGTGPRIAICMATYNPPADLLRRQLDSIRAQEHDAWVCVISDDASDEERFAGLLDAIGGDPRFAVSRSAERLGFYRNFERALAMTPADAELVGLCDQDDFWRPDKLGRLVEALGDAELAYSDARVVSPSGDVVHPSYWTERRNNYTSFASLVLANSVTGAASLFRRDLLDDALPFPPALADPYHDHWLAVVAMARGRLAYLDEPLYDYVQHGGAVIGHDEANRKPRPVRQHLMERLRNPGGGSRRVYYYNWHQLLVNAKVLRIRCGDRMEPGKRRTLDRLVGADRGVAGLGWLLARRMRKLWGRDETLDRELFYAYALGRRRAVSAWTLGRRRPPRVLPRDESVPSPPDGDAA
jgi:glycosyltransferase involved in cell wall biosynthesis